MNESTQIFHSLIHEKNGLNLHNKSQIEGRVKQSPREAMLIKQAEAERDSENRAEILQNLPNPRRFRKFLFPQLTPSGPLGLILRRMTEERTNWPRNERDQI